MLAKKTASEWPELALALYQHRNTHRQPMTFNRPGMRWQIPIYKDKSPIMVIVKSVQCGITEFALIWTIERCRQGWSVLYVMPTLTDRNDFVNDRIEPLFNEVSFYHNALGITDNVGMKKLYGGTIKFVSSQVLSSFKGFPAQALVVDELNVCDPRNIIYGIDRLASAKQMTGQEPRQLFISNPSISNYGISQKYNESDKKSWQIKCPHCNKWQLLDWFKNVVRQTDDNTYFPICSSLSAGGDIQCLCRFCNKAIDRLAAGEWIPEYPDRDVSGRHVSMLMTGQRPVNYLWQLFQEGMSNQSKMEQFYNSCLGVPYTGTGHKLDYALLAKLAGEYRMPNSAKDTVAGIDVGKLFHIKISEMIDGKLKAVFIGSCVSPNEVVRVLKQFGVSRYVIDAAPELHLAKLILQKHPGGYLCRYAAMADRAKGESLNRSERIVTVNRTESIDEMVAAHLNGQIVLPMDWATVENGDYLAHMIAPTRVLDSKRNPPAYVWDEGDDPDHLFHASNYEFIAAKMMGFGKGNIGVTWL